jgi:hypothetical protein
MRMKKLRPWIALWAVVFATACDPDISTYKAAEPKLDIREYFSGRLSGVGTVTDYTGEVTERFTIDADAKWEGNQGTLKETFRHADGREVERMWNLSVNDAGLVRARATNVKGEAKGEQQGNALFLDYTLLETEAGQKVEYDVADRFFLVDSIYLMNHGAMKRMGMPMKSWQISFHKLNEWN